MFWHLLCTGINIYCIFWKTGCGLKVFIHLSFLSTLFSLGWRADAHYVFVTGKFWCRSIKLRLIFSCIFIYYLNDYQNIASVCSQQTQCTMHCCRNPCRAPSSKESRDCFGTFFSLRTLSNSVCVVLCNLISQYTSFWKSSVMPTCQD